MAPNDCEAWDAQHLPSSGGRNAGHLCILSPLRAFLSWIPCGELLAPTPDCPHSPLQCHAQPENQSLGLLLLSPSLAVPSVWTFWSTQIAHTDLMRLFWPGFMQVLGLQKEHGKYDLLLICPKQNIRTDMWVFFLKDRIFYKITQFFPHCPSEKKNKLHISQITLANEHTITSDRLKLWIWSHAKSLNYLCS